MSADLEAAGGGEGAEHAHMPTNGEREVESGTEQEEEEDAEEEDEPKLKYAKLTGSLSGVYRNGDSTSASLTAGDKLVVGTHSGSIHVMAVPSLKSLRTYRAHQASVTSVSISPTPPPPGNTASASSPLPNAKTPPARAAPNASNGARSARAEYYIATSSMDGHVCVSSLTDPADVLLRNFARPINAVALSPDYRNDKTYLSGGLAGNLILTVGGTTGRSQDANTNSNAATSGWLGIIGLGGNAGKDVVLHSGEGAISSIQWSRTGKWVVWVNEEGIKICRSHLRLGSEETEDAWRRIAHAARPNRKGWEEMAGVWKGRCEWIEDNSLETDGFDEGEQDTNGNGTVKSTTTPRPVKVEKLVVGWGDTAWVMHVHESRAVTAGKRQVGSADIVHKLQFRDCVISGITFYTSSLLAILAYRTRDDDDKPIAQHNQPDIPKKGRQHRHTSLAPQLRLINVVNGEEVELDELSRISRFETLSAQDYQLCTLHVPPRSSAPEKSARDRGALEGLWDAAGGGYATRMFSSGGSVRSGGSEEKDGGCRRVSVASPKPGSGSTRGVEASPALARQPVDAHPYLLQPGLKLFVQSPYDCVLTVKRGLSDHLEWLLEHHQYGEAWRVIDEHPEVVSIISGTTVVQSHESSLPSSPSQTPSGAQNGTLAEFFADAENGSQSSSAAGFRAHNSTAQKEKRRIGDLWLQQLVAARQWTEAGKVAGRVLGTSSRWEHWVWTFAQASQFDAITPYIPSTSLKPPLPSLVYEVVLGHYISDDPRRVGRLLDDWDPELFDVQGVVRAIEDRLPSGDEGEEDDEDRRSLIDALARLYLAAGRARDSLKCYLRLQDAEKAFALLRDDAKLLTTAAEDIPGLLMLRVSTPQMRTAPLSELADCTAEAIALLVAEAHRGTIPAAAVISQLTRAGDRFQPFLYFYFAALWHSNTSSGRTPGPPSHKRFHLATSSLSSAHALVDDHADLAVRLFALYDRSLLLTYLQTSSSYAYDAAAELCERAHYIPELILLLSRTGQTKRALNLIIGELGDVEQALRYAGEHPDLWEDLLEYSLARPPFIRGLLAQVGALPPPTEDGGGGGKPGVRALDVVRRIPAGLEIEGLKGAVQTLTREFEIQVDISAGVARVLSGEVGGGMETLRSGRRKGVRFAAAGKCVGCGEGFVQDEEEGGQEQTIIGFACGHVYHLSCLLDANSATADSGEAEDLLRQLGGAHRPGEDDGGRSVGAKVAHAHIIRGVVQGGCRHCVVVHEET